MAAKIKTQSRLAEMETKFQDLNHNERVGASVGMEAIALFAIKKSLSVALEDNVFRGEEERQARDLMTRVKARLDLLKNKQENHG